MSVVDYYKLLGIDPDADEQTIRTAIRRTRGRYRQQAGSPSLEQRAKAEQMIARIAEAETAFETPESRKAYDATLAARPSPPPPADPQRDEPRRRQEEAPRKDWRKAAEDYLDAGEVRSAIGAAKEATRADPGDARAWQLRSRASLAGKDFHDAEFAATEAMKLLPGDGAGLGLRGDVLRAEGRHSQAEDAYRAAAELSPADPYWPAQVAFSLLDQDLPQQAVKEAREAVVRFAGEQYARDTLARVLVADSEAAMSNDDGGGIYVASKRQIAHIESRLEEIGSLAPLSHSAQAHRDRLQRTLSEAKARRYVPPSSKLVGWVLGWVFVGSWLSWLVLASVLGDVAGLLAAVVLNLGLLAWLLLRLFPEQWRLNRRVLGETWVRTGLT